MAWARLLSSTAIVLCLAGCGWHRERGAPGDRHGTLVYGGLQRTYLMHAPPRPAVGLVLNLHGGGSNGVEQEGLTGFDEDADANDLLVVYPDGYDRSWADGRGKSPADRKHVDDVGFLVALTDKVRNDFGIAAGRVFATGMSNGAFMINRLACDRADVVAAIAPVAGTLGEGVPCHPSRPVSMLDSHGTADPLVPFDGGEMRGPSGPSRVLSAPDLVSRWRAADGCQGDPVDQQLPDSGDGTTVHRFDSGACAAATEVMFYRIDNGGHTWPDGMQYLPELVIGTTTRAYDGSAVIARFFLAHASG